MKTCPKCKKELEDQEFMLSSGKMRVYCHPCMREYKRQSYAKNPEKHIEKVRKYKENNMDKVEKYQQEYRNTHRKELNESAKEYRESNADMIREKDRIRNQSEDRKQKQRARFLFRYHNDEEFRKNLIEKGKKARTKWYNKNRKSILQKAKEGYWKDPEKAREKSSKSVGKWRKSHPDQARAILRQRKAIRKGAYAENFDENSYEKWLMKWQHGKCYFCNQDFSAERKRELEHFIAIRNDGQHRRTNLTFACKSCNSSKGKKFAYHEWFPGTVFVHKNFCLEEEVTNEFGAESPVLILSTFFLSERNNPNAKNEMEKIRKQNDGKLLFYDFEWENRRSAIKNLVATKTGFASKIGARETQVVEVCTEDAKEFFEKTHIQGFGRGSIYLGLIYKGELVGLTAWLISDDHIELNRLAFYGSVVGGFSKLVSALKSHEAYNGQPITSFVDTRYATGDSYEKIGFEYAGETASPVYYYVNGSGFHHRRGFMKNKMDKNFLFFKEELSEHENAKANNFFRLYGLKQKRFIMR